MTVAELSLDTLVNARERLVAEIVGRARAKDARRFLSSFHELKPDWDTLGYDPAIAELPALRWKLLNLARLRDQNPAKFEDQACALDQCLTS